MKKTISDNGNFVDGSKITKSRYPHTFDIVFDDAKTTNVSFRF